MRLIDRHTEEFLPGDAMHGAVFAVERCLAVCPSVRQSQVLCQLKTAKHINQIYQTFSLSGSHTILVYSISNIVAIPTGTS